MRFQKVTISLPWIWSPLADWTLKDTPNQWGEKHPKWIAVYWLCFNFHFFDKEKENQK